MNSCDVTMTSYCLYNFIVINLAEVSSFSNLVFNWKALTKSIPKCIICQFPSTEWKAMASFVFFIVTTFQIWACHVTCVYKLAENFISRDTLLNFRKVTKNELDTCTGSRVIKKISLGGLKAPPTGGIGLIVFFSTRFQRARGCNYGKETLGSYIWKERDDFSSIFFRQGHCKIAIFFPKIQ